MVHLLLVVLNYIPILFFAKGDGWFQSASNITKLSTFVNDKFSTLHVIIIISALPVLKLSSCA